jgi:hypothetical protein
MVSGAPPFVAESVAGVLVAVTSDDPTALDGEVPAALAAIVRRCLDKDRAGRPPSVGALAHALAPFGGQAGIGLAASVDVAERRGARLATTEHRAPAVFEMDRAAAVAPPPPPPPRRISWSGIDREREAARRRAWRAALLGAAIVLAAAATLAMPGGRMTQRALRDLADPPVVDRGPPPLPAEPEPAGPPAPPLLEPQVLRIETTAPVLVKVSASTKPKPRAAHLNGFTHPSQLR